MKDGKVYAKDKDIWAVDLAEVGSLSSKNRGVKCLLYVIYFFTKYAWVKPLTNQKTETDLNGFAGIVNKFKHKPNNLWADKGK